ncbi:hypothetical protein BPO_1355 [Bergeyella porcorum]|uniref:Uncharacterized protein n=1 Tax=Bergeyella porcorum TaxID=1735111 RepID=A0AAU0F315_9FLAO
MLSLLWVKVWDFVSNAGKIIFAVSIILWALSYFGPKQEAEQWVATDVEMKTLIYPL